MGLCRVGLRKECCFFPYCSRPTHTALPTLWSGLASINLKRKNAMSNIQSIVAPATPLYYFLQLPSYEQVLSGQLPPEGLKLSVIDYRPKPQEDYRAAQSVFAIDSEKDTLYFLDFADQFDCLDKACLLVEEHTPFKSIREQINLYRKQGKMDWLSQARACDEIEMKPKKASRGR